MKPIVSIRLGIRGKILCAIVVTVLLVRTSRMIWYSSILFEVTPLNNFTNETQQHVVPAILKRAFENVTGSAKLDLNITKQTTNLFYNNVSETGIHRITPSFRNEQPTNYTKTPWLFTRPPWLSNKTDYPLTLDGNYVINPAGICPTTESLDYLIIVNSATTYFWKRQAMRQTFAAKLQFGEYRQAMVFLLGLNEDPETTAKIKEESILYGDIVQGAFKDSYHNLTHKSVMGLRWIAENCLQAKLILKLDDDVFVNPFLFVNELAPDFKNKKLQIGCDTLDSNDWIYRGRHIWAVSEDEFKGLKVYPFTRCRGYFVIMTTDLIKPMLQAARLNPFFWIDDVYLYGMLPATIGGVTFYNATWRLAQTTQSFKDCYTSKGLNCEYVGVIHRDQGHVLWRMLMEKVPVDMKKQYHVLN